MFLKNFILPVALICATGSYAYEQEPHSLDIQLGWSYLKPMSNNHTYAFDVAGTQPYFQDWHAQAVNPKYTSSWELGLRYALRENRYNLAVNWLHLNSSDSDGKSGNQTLSLADIEFVAPPFE